jgi:hypothetical protein
MTSYFAIDLPIHTQLRLTPPVQILVCAEVGFAPSFLKLSMLIIGTKDLLFCIHFIISSSSYICHGVGPLVDPFRSHLFRSLFKGLP